MPTNWLEPDHVGDFEACKDDAYKVVLGCLGQWVTFTYDGLGKVDERIFAYFEREHEEITIGADLSFSSSDPIVECRYSDFDNVPAQGDGVIVVEKLGEVELTLTFEITDRHEPDEQGAMMFVLELKNATRVKV